MAVAPRAPSVSGPLGEFIDGFSAELAARQYSARSFKAQFWIVRQLSQWLSIRGLEVAELTDDVVEQFVAERRGTTTKLRSTRALALLLSYLRSLGVVPEPIEQPPSTPVQALLERFERFLVMQRNLAPWTVRSYVSQVRPFVTEHLAADGGGLWSLTAQDVDRFIVSWAGKQRPRSVQARANALRALLRWMWQEHLIPRPLDGAVGRFASPSAATVSPTPLTEAEIEQLFGALGEDPRVRLRNTAMVILMLRLGLRAGEVASLRLDDVDWRSGVLSIRGKRGRLDQVPLPVDVGSALSAYLRHGRPTPSAHRQIFLTVCAPHGPVGPMAVTNVVGRALAAAGIEGPGAAHRLRHTAAGRVLAAGGGLVEVGQLLRHESPGATAVYARSNLQALGALACVWPTGADR